MRTPIMAGNWKMHKTVGEAIDFVTRLHNELGDWDKTEAVVAPPRARSIPRYSQPTMPGYPQERFQQPARPAQKRMRKTKCPNCGQRFPVQGGPGPVRVECPYCGMRGMMP